MRGLLSALAIAFLLNTAAGSLNAAVSIHVSTQGNDDSGDGSATRPFASLHAAQRRVRQLLAEQPQAVRVQLAAGVYWLDKPLELGNEDSGLSAAEPVVYAAAGGEVVLSGGRPITAWRKQDGRWIAKVELNDELPPFRDLWVNGRRAVRSRAPNQGYYRVVSAGPDNRTSFAAAEGEVVNVANPHAAEAVLLHDWSMSRVPLASIDPSSRTYRTIAPLGADMAQFAITNFEPHPRYFIENAPELVDSPGEWHLDEAAGQLHYMPREGEHPDDQDFEAIAPRLNELLVIRGRGELPVKHLRFEGLTFAHSQFAIPKYGYAGIQATVHERRTTVDDRQNVMMPAAVTVEQAEDCQFQDCRFQSLAGCGWQTSRSQNVRVAQCRFSDIGGNGVLIGTRNDGDRPLTRNVSITDCTIEQCGVSFFGAVGVWVGIAQDALIAHNEVRRLPYTGVSVGWRWDDTPTGCRGNRIEGNHIHHVMQTLSDGGGIYTLGRQPGTRLALNHIHDVPVNAGRAESNGIFMDEGSTEITVENNTIYHIARSPIRFHRAGKNLVAGNRLVARPDVPTFMYNATDEGVIERVDNVVASAESWQPPAEDAAASMAGVRTD